MKKLISISLILSLMMSVFPLMPVSYADGNEIKYIIFDDAYMQSITTKQSGALLETLGIMPQNTNKDVVLTRGKAAYYLSKLANLPLVDEKSKFSDVPDAHIYKNEINACVTYGIIECDSKYFKPNDGLKTNELVSVFAKLLGYDQFGGASSTLTSTLLKGAKFPGGILTEKAFGIVAENALEEKCIKAVSNSIFGTEYGVGNTTLMYSLMKTEYLDGTIYSIGTNSLSGYTADAGYINVSGTLIRADVPVDISLLSREIRAYYTDVDGEYVLKGITPLKNKAEYVRLHYTQLNSTSPSYTKQNVSAFINNRIENYNIAQNAAVIYNGRVVPEYEKADICPAYGEMLLIDDDFDDIFDTVMVYDFDVKAIKFIYWYSQRLSCYDDTSYGGELDEENDVSYVCYRNGEPCEMTDFQVDDVIAVAIPKTRVDAVCYIFGTDTKVDGLVQSVDNNKAVINGVEYSISNNSNNIKAGVQGTFCVDAYNGINLLPKGRTDNFTYGYVVSKSTGADPENDTVKIFSEDGSMARYPVAYKVKLDNVFVSDADVFAQLPIEILIKYRLNEEGRLVQICTPSSEKLGVSPYDTSKFSLDFKKSARFMGGVQQALEGYYLGDGNTVLMRIPTFADAEDDDYYIMDSSNIIGGYQYNFEVYESDEQFKPDIVLVKMSWKYGRTLNGWDKNTPVIVSSVNVGLHDGEPRYEIEVFSKQNYDTVYADYDLKMKWDEVFKATYADTYPCPDGDNEFTPLDLKPGDIIHIDEPEGKKLTNVRMLYRNDQQNPVTNPEFKEYFYNQTAGVVYDDSTWHYLSLTMKGKIHYIGDTYVVIKTGDGLYRTMAKTLTGKLSFPGVVYNTLSKELRLAKPTDWRVGKNVVIHSNYCTLDAILIME